MSVLQFAAGKVTVCCQRVFCDDSASPLLHPRKRDGYASEIPAAPACHFGYIGRPRASAGKPADYEAAAAHHREQAVDRRLRQDARAPDDPRVRAVLALAVFE